MKKILLISLFLIFFIKIGYCEQRILYLHIYGPGQKGLNIYVAPPMFLGKQKQKDKELIADKIYKVILTNISYLPFLNLVPGEDIVGGPEIKGVTLKDIDFHKFSINRIDLLTTIGWSILDNNKIKIEIRTFDVFSSTLYIGRGYLLNTESQVYIAANRYCRDLMKKLTGKQGFFSSMLAFIKKDKDGSKNIYISTPQGYFRQKITNLKGLALSPSWSWDSNYIVFTYLSLNTHELLLWSRNGKLRRIMVPGNTIISPTFTPQGNIVVSTDMSGNPDIYLLDKNFKIKKALVKTWAIDISPSFDNTGEKMVYVSSIYGNPNIFLYDFKTKQTKRISYIGKYNTNPCISGNGKFVVYSTFTEKGHRIVLCDLSTLEEKIITHGPGSDEHPVWGPDSYFIAFCSSRTGNYKIYITTKEATPPKVVNTGDGDTTSVAWSKKF